MAYKRLIVNGTKKMAKVSPKQLAARAKFAAMSRARAAERNGISIAEAGRRAAKKKTAKKKTAKKKSKKLPTYTYELKKKRRKKAPAKRNPGMGGAAGGVARAKALASEKTTALAIWEPQGTSLATGSVTQLATKPKAKRKASKPQTITVEAAFKAVETAEDKCEKLNKKLKKQLKVSKAEIASLKKSLAAAESAVKRLKATVKRLKAGSAERRAMERQTKVVQERVTRARRRILVTIQFYNSNGQKLLRSGGKTLSGTRTRKAACRRKMTKKQKSSAARRVRAGKPGTGSALARIGRWCEGEVKVGSRTKLAREAKKVQPALTAKQRREIIRNFNDTSQDLMK